MLRHFATFREKESDLFVCRKVIGQRKFQSQLQEGALLEGVYYSTFYPSDMRSAGINIERTMKNSRSDFFKSYHHRLASLCVGVIHVSEKRTLAYEEVCCHITTTYDRHSHPGLLHILQRWCCLHPTTPRPLC